MTDHDRDHDTFRRAFEIAHEETEAATPSFRGVLSRAQSGEASGHRIATKRWAAVVLGVFAIALVCGVNFTDWTRGGDLRLVHGESLALTEWRAPLDFLLETPGREWLDSTPTLAYSVSGLELPILESTDSDLVSLEVLQ